MLREEGSQITAVRY